MLLTIIILPIISALSALAYTPSSDAYALAKVIPMLSATNFLFDGPASISGATTTPTTNPKPTLVQMMYYNYYAASMYCEDQLRDLSCLYCQKFKYDVDLSKVIIVNNQDVEVIALITLSTSRNEIVVTFRGGQNSWSSILALTLFSVCYPGKACDIKLHTGFYTAAMALYDEVIRNVIYLLSLHPDYKIVIAGHSLGGAVARITTFFILYLEQFPGKKLELYTYGEPRNGNKAFVDFMNRQNIVTARVTARADLAVHYVPTSVLGTSALGEYYLHAQTEFWINGTTGQKFADQSVYEDSTCSNSMGPAYNVPDHFLYFDANLLVCWLNDPRVWLEIPTDVFQPTEIIPPPLPQIISSYLGAAIGFVSNSLGPLLGR